MNNKISLGSHYIIKILALKQLVLRENMMILDACCGTGDFVRILSKSGLRVIGLDFSKEMIKIAKSKNPHGVFIHGDVTDLAFGENEFDVITMGFGLRNVENRKKALEEIRNQYSIDDTESIAKDTDLEFDFDELLAANTELKNKEDR
jgi:demethylmenaquinone methyltransferase/2-methoxy-6-polyprenyl-1,4-benzoquinol methylase